MSSTWLLERQGAKWWHTADYGADHGHVNLTKARLGDFTYAILSAGAHIGDFWGMNHKYRGSYIQVSVLMTDEMKTEIESTTRFRFQKPVELVPA